MRGGRNTKQKNVLMSVDHNEGFAWEIEKRLNISSAFIYKAVLDRNVIFLTVH